MFSPYLSTGALHLRRPATHLASCFARNGGAYMILNSGASCTPPQPVFNRWDRKTWYKPTIPLAEPWLCDWENWCNAIYFHDAHSGLSPEAIYLTWWPIPGEPYPLAFLPHWSMPEPTYVFVADGRYYCVQYSHLKRIKGPFASHNHFLRRLGEDKCMYEQGTQIPNSPDWKIAAASVRSFQSLLPTGTLDKVVLFSRPIAQAACDIRPGKKGRLSRGWSATEQNRRPLEILQKMFVRLKPGPWLVRLFSFRTEKPQGSKEGPVTDGPHLH
ncbi:hypothetical protein B0H16DRAFT_1450822 [Mycena metata]|uniref:Uncharacterized protein n=1 Tax=Mycena metata TaxID=1033252 RepID=A0AAD7JXL7_9AGAR|nr:hypothetical protein B0H16DRAFT_1450822 [Mycena metata]